MRIRLIVAALVAVLCCGSWTYAQNHEVVLGTTFIDAPQSGYEFPFYSNGISGKLNIANVELGTSFGYGNFPKQETPGGHRRAFGVFTNYWFGEHVFVGADWSNVFGDATAWTKEVEFAGVNAGYRLVGKRRMERIWTESGFREVSRGGRHEDRFVFSYDREIKTDAVQPNNSEYFAARWYHDFPINGTFAIRSALSFSHGRFDQFVFFDEADANGLRHRLPTGEIQRLSSNSVSWGFSLLIH